MPIKAQGIEYNGYMTCGINKGSGDPEPHLGVLTIGVLVFGEFMDMFFYFKQILVVLILIFEQLIKIIF